MLTNVSPELPYPNTWSPLIVPSDALDLIHNQYTLRTIADS